MEEWTWLSRPNCDQSSNARRCVFGGYPYATPSVCLGPLMCAIRLTSSLVSHWVNCKPTKVAAVVMVAPATLKHGTSTYLRFGCGINVSRAGMSRAKLAAAFANCCSCSSHWSRASGVAQASAGKPPTIAINRRVSACASGVSWAPSRRRYGLASDPI